MAYGSMAPALTPMAVPPLMDSGIGAQGQALLQAVLRARGNRPGVPPAPPADTGAPGADGTAAPGGGGAGMPGGSFMQNMMSGPGMGLLSKLFPQQPVAMPDMGGGGMGLSPTALTGLW